MSRALASALGRVLAGVRPWALGGALLPALALAGCGRDAGPQATAPPPAPVTLRATTILEPPVLQVGDTAVLEVAVATPPDFEVEAPEPPEEVPGLWLLGAELPTVERGEARWVHRTRFRVRARDTGAFTWPALPLTLRDAEDRPRTLEAPARPFEVVSVLGDGDAPQGFLDYRVPATRGAPGPGVGLAALVGAAAALAGVGLLLLVRRVRAAERGARSGEGAAALAGLVGPWRAAHATLETAEARAAEEPVRAADLAASALRVLASRRVDPALVTRTTEELAARPAPATLEAAWPELVALLRDLDAVRFAPAAAAPEAVRELVGRGRDLADRLGPRGSTR